MGQCFPLPDDKNLQTEMGKHAHNHQFIFDQYNFDVETPPGSDMEKAERLWRRKQARHSPLTHHACSALHMCSLAQQENKLMIPKYDIRTLPSTAIRDLF